MLRTCLAFGKDELGTPRANDRLRVLFTKHSQPSTVGAFEAYVGVANMVPMPK